MDDASRRPDRLHIFSGKVLRSEQRGICAECGLMAWLSPMGRIMPHQGRIALTECWEDWLPGETWEEYSRFIHDYWEETKYCTGIGLPPRPSEARADPYEMSGDYDDL